MVSCDFIVVMFRDFLMMSLDFQVVISRDVFSLIQE